MKSPSGERLLDRKKSTATFLLLLRLYFVQRTSTIKSFTAGYLLSSIFLGCFFFSLAFVLSWTSIITNLRNELLQ